MNVYCVEHLDGQGNVDTSKPEAEGLTRQRAHELAKRHCRMNPRAAAIIYMEVYKPDTPKRMRKGEVRRSHAMRVFTAANLYGRGFGGKKPLRSVMQRAGKIDELDVPQLVVA